MRPGRPTVGRAHRVVRSRPGAAGTVGSGFLLLLAVGLVVAASASWSGGGFRWELLALYVLALLCARLGVAGVATRVRVDLRGLQTRGPLGRREVAWVDVREVWIDRTLLGGFNLQVRVRGSPLPVSLFTALMGNGADVARAILEAARAADPSVPLTGWGERAFGRPPYGVFGELREPSDGHDGATAGAPS